MAEEAGEEVVEVARVKTISKVSLLLGIALLLLTGLGIYFKWTGSFLPFVLLAAILIVASYFFSRESKKEEKELSDQDGVELPDEDESRGGDDSEGV